jgi:hypothetical protein
VRPRASRDLLILALAPAPTLILTSTLTRCALEPRDLLELGPDAHRAGASYSLEASERLIVLLFRRREEEAVAE